MTFVYFLYVVFTLVYVLADVTRTNRQPINRSIAAKSNGMRYTEEAWTPETWYRAVLDLPLSSQADSDHIRHWLSVIQAWKWNLIPLSGISCAVTVLAMAVTREIRKSYQQAKLLPRSSLEGKAAFPRFEWPDEALNSSDETIVEEDEEDGSSEAYLSNILPAF